MEIKGNIRIRKLNLMGYTPTTQIYIVNSCLGKGIPNGYNNSIDFLKSISKHLTLTTDGYSIVATRLPKFREHVAANGFNLIED